MMSLSGHRKRGDGGGEVEGEKKKKTKKKQTPAKGHATKSKGGKKSWKKPDVSFFGLTNRHRSDMRTLS